MKLRFAPSPTGLLHVGNARTLILNWLYAKKHGADFVLRFDNTDQERCKDEYIAQIKKDMGWLGLDYSAEFKQCDRIHLYEAAAEALKKSGRLYPCYETKNELDFKRKRQLSQGRPPLYDRAALRLTSQEIEKFEAEGRTPHWRFQLDLGEITWDDVAHGPITFKGEHLSDPILIRENGVPLFTLSGVVDDIDMAVTHIVRGDDHISNTAIQIQILEALGGKVTDFTFAHVPLLMGAGGESLSKRLGSLSLKELCAQGYESQAVLNYLGQLGNPGEQVTHATKDSLADSFSLRKFGKSSPKYDEVELDRENARLLHLLSYDQIKERLADCSLSAMTADLWETIKGNLTKLADAAHYIEVCFDEVTPMISDQDYIDQAKNTLPKAPWSEETWSQWTSTLKTDTGRKGKLLFMPLRQALTGEDHGPEMKKILPFIGYDKAYARLCGKKA